MDQVRACRICLVTGVKMYDLRSYPLANYFKSVAGLSDPAILDLPPYACYECSAYIRNTFLFHEKCLRGQSTLYNILRSKGKITETSVQSVDRLQLNLSSKIKCNVIPKSVINITHEYPDISDIKEEPQNDVISQEQIEDVEIDFFKEEMEYTNLYSPGHSLSDDEDEPLSFHKSKNKAIETKVDKGKRKRKVQNESKIEIEIEAMSEENVGTSQQKDSSETTVKRKRGRPKKNKGGPAKKERPAVTRRTENTGGVDNNDIDLEEYVTIIKLTKEEQMEEVTKRQTSSNYQNALYKCNLCFKGFIDTDAWEHHVNKHKPDENNSGTSASDSFEVQRTNIAEKNLQPVDVITISSGRDSEASKEKSVKWTLCKRFPSHHAATYAVAIEGTWTLCNCHYTQKGYQKLYKCDKFKRIGSKCPAKACLSFKVNSKYVALYISDTIHNHDHPGDFIKDEVKKMFELKMTTETIMNVMGKLGTITIPDISEVKKYLSNLRLAKLQSNKICLKELKTWMQSNVHIPSRLNESFLICNEVSEENSEFLFALSNKLLLGIAKEATVIQVDTRYKFIWQGYSVFVLGTTDNNHKFHPLCLAITTSEDKDQFKLIFTGLKNSVQQLFRGFFWKPKVLLCNGAQNIERAFIEVFGDDVVVRTCWLYAHSKMFGKLQNQETQKVIMADIDALQLATNPNTFDKASKAFLVKYKSHAGFVKYFEEQWLLKNRNWYLGAAANSPSSNEALSSLMLIYEYSNKKIQPESDLRCFLAAVSGIIMDWTQKYVPRPDSHFSKEPTIALTEWQKSYNWSTMPKVVSEMAKDNTHVYYRVPAADADECEEFDEPWETFDDFKRQNNSTWFVSLPVDKDRWREGKCNCPAFYKMYICKHVIGMAIRLGHVNPPAEARVKYRRGRW